MRADWQLALTDFTVALEQSGRSASTCDGYLKHVGWLADRSASGPWQLTTSELTDWLDSRQWSRETRRKVLVSFRVFYGWAASEGLCVWAPTAGLPSAAPNKRGPAKRELPAAWAPAVEGFIVWARAGARSEGTVEQHRWWLGRLAEVAADPWAVTTQQLAQWLSNPDWAPETKRRGRSSVRMFYRWAERTGHVRASPAADLDPVRLARALPRPAPTEALRIAFSVADDRQRLALMLAAYAGLRRAEIASLHTSQISAVDLLIIGKGGHQRRVPLHPELRNELAAEMARRRRETGGSDCQGYLFPSSHGGHLTPQHLGKIVARCLPDEWTTHSLRHRFATAAYCVQRDLRAVQELLGHTKPETTARYAAVPDGALMAAVSGVGL